MDMSSRSCPVGAAQRRLGASHRPAQFFDADDSPAQFFEADDSNFESIIFNAGEENDVTTVCSEPPKSKGPTPTSPAMAAQTYHMRKVASARSPTSVHEMPMFEQILERQILEEEEDNKFKITLNEDYSVNKRRVSDVDIKLMWSVSPKVDAALLKEGKTGITRNPNLDLVDTDSPVAVGSQRNTIPNISGSQLPNIPPTRSAFQRLFACGAPGVGEMNESIHEFKTNVKQKGVNTVEEVKGSFGDLGLTMRQVFSPLKNMKKEVNKCKGEEVDYYEATDDEDDFAEDDTNGDVTDEGDDEEEGFLSGTSSAHSYCESEYITDESEGSDSKQVTVSDVDVYLVDLD